jgi:hypothetical protein
VDNRQKRSGQRAVWSWREKGELANEREEGGKNDKGSEMRDASGKEEEDASCNRNTQSSGVERMCSLDIEGIESTR